MFVFTRCLLCAEVSWGARTAFAEKTLMEEPPEEVVSEVSSLPSVGSSAGSYWSTTMRSWCWTNLAAAHLSFRMVSWSSASLNAFFFFADSFPIFPLPYKAGKMPLKSKSPAPLNIMAKTPFRGPCPSHVPRASTKHAREGTEQCLPTSLGRVAQ